MSLRLAALAANAAAASTESSSGSSDPPKQSSAYSILQKGEAASGGAASVTVSSGLAISNGFAVAPSVCEAPREDRFVNQKFLQQLLVDKDLKTVYCFVPKAACTSWKVWFRQQQAKRHPGTVRVWKGLPERLVVHDPIHSGLRILSRESSEAKVIRFLTRPDFFKFTFVRNPFTRIASAYLNKHVNGGYPHNRKYWNERFFNGIAPYEALMRRQNGSDFIQFGDFMWLLKIMAQHRLSRMDPHAKPQINLCKLDRIRYDFIGRFENLDADVVKVMHQFGLEEKEAFSEGHGAHPTNAGDKLADLYDKRAYDALLEAYAPDFQIPLNNITYEAPLSLKERYN
eukprot:TRINITY_DN17391_c1_g2_i1.p1 TRINITY_DN17391_c1_g2~~TRINITY_DN17391_c1_g2_i1.p1  ORF type:complete len:342 (+),score=19.17 TRINITY_DN17391_c1_g2_i1:3-1028(+)